MHLLNGIVMFVVHVLIIMLGVHLAGVRGAGFVKALAIAILSFLAWLLLWFVFGLFTLPFMLFGFTSWLVKAAMLFFAIAIGSKHVLDIPWEKSYSIAFVVVAANALLTLIMH